MPKVVTRKLREPPDLRECWSLNEHVQSNKRPTNESRNLDYHSMIKKPFIKTEDSISSDNSLNKSENGENILVESDEPINPVGYHDKHDNEYLDGSDVSIEKFDASHLLFKEASGTDISNDDEATMTTLQAWLQHEISAEKYFPECPDLASNKLIDKYSSDDDDCVPQSSYTDEQPFAQESSNSQTAYDQEESSAYPLHNMLQMAVDEDPIACDIRLDHQVSQRNNPRDYYRKIDKDSPILPKAKAMRVKNWRELNTADNYGIRKNRIATEQPDTASKESYHNGRRITRSLIKSIGNTSANNDAENQIGQFVWGYCMGWWPAIIVAAEDVGIETKADKVCVYWIGEDLISLLNEKTQVEPFQTNLEVRLLRYFKGEEGTKDRRKVSFITLKLFSKYLGIPLIKPYIKWAEKHLLGKIHLNKLRFCPFPKNMQQRLDQLKQKNIKTTQKNARHEERAREARSSTESCPSNDPEPRDSLDKNLQDNARGKFPKDLIRKTTNELLLNSSDKQHILPLMDQKPGVIVWGKICGHSWWPAMIVHNHDCGTKEPNFGCQWIIWYGDYQLSQVHYQNVMKFDEGIKKMQGYITQCKREKYIKAVLSACKDHCARLTYDTSNWTMVDVLAWVKNLKSNVKMSAIPRPNDGRLESRYSAHIAEKLNEMKSNQEVAAERESSIQNCDALKAIFAGLSDNRQVLCIICLKICYNGIDHPFFECILCNSCAEDFKATIFAYGDDGKCFYCTLCAGSNTVVMCDSYDCPRVYCTACLKYLICPLEYNEILVKDPWLCFLCDDTQSLHKNRLFKPRSDWKARIGQLFNTNQDTNWNDVRTSNGENKRMRVLSLFDGISTGLLVLEKLGIEVEDYYAAEIDQDAEIVSASYFGNRICRLGDVRNITKDTIEAIAPIDLLIGGSPCNDLSLANPNRLGLHDKNGTGILFFDYCRIKKLITEANEGHHLFWLFENVASMPSPYRLAINESLECEPSLIDAADFSPQHRPRLFWSNLPIGSNFPPPDPSQDLQSVLTPNCNRHALVKKIRTVTTKVNSLKQGVSLLKPVLMNEEADSLWITELEEIFGFPKHYTDVKNLSATKRQKLIGQAWSVQTITAILRPLCYFFVTKTLQSRD